MSVDSTESNEPFANASWLWLPPVVSALLLASALAGRATIDGHEVLVAQTAREMRASGDWLMPRFGGEPRLLKPPLAYWLTAIVFSVTGIENETTARLPSAFATVLGVALLTWWSRRVWSGAVGTAAGLVHATSYWAIAYGRSAMVDAVLVALATAAMVLAALDRAIVAQPTKPRIWLTALSIWVILGLIVLAKGPVGLALVLPAIVVYRWRRRRSAHDLPLCFHPAGAIGALVFLVVALGWPVAVWLMHPEVVAVWREQSVGRFVERWGPQTRPWHYFLYVVPVLTLPWSWFWLKTLGLELRRHMPALVGSNVASRNDERLLLWLWFGVGFTLLSASAGKREHYILPCLPPLCVLAALALRAADWARFRATFGVAVAAASVALAFVLPHWERREGALGLFARQRDALQAADRVIQYGSNDHWTIFAIDRAMAWPRSTAELRRLVRESPKSLLLVSESRVAEVIELVPAIELDRGGAARSWAERDPRQHWVLLRPIHSANLALGSTAK